MGESAYFMLVGYEELWFHLGVWILEVRSEKGRSVNSEMCEKIVMEIGAIDK